MPPDVFSCTDAKPGKESRARHRHGDCEAVILTAGDEADIASSGVVIPMERRGSRRSPSGPPPDTSKKGEAAWPAPTEFVLTGV